jgi:hypothetical protein
MLRNQQYADVSPIAEARMEMTYRLGRTMLVQRVTVALRTSLDLRRARRR